MGLSFPGTDEKGIPRNRPFAMNLPEQRQNRWNRGGNISGKFRTHTMGMEISTLKITNKLDGIGFCHLRYFAGGWESQVPCLRHLTLYHTTVKLLHGDLGGEGVRRCFQLSIPDLRVKFSSWKVEWPGSKRKKEMREREREWTIKILQQYKHSILLAEFMLRKAFQTEESQSGMTFLGLIINT